MVCRVGPALSTVKHLLREGQPCFLLLLLAHPQMPSPGGVPPPLAPWAVLRLFPFLYHSPSWGIMGTTENPATLHQATVPSNQLAKPPHLQNLSVRNRHQSSCSWDPCTPAVPRQALPRPPHHAQLCLDSKCTSGQLGRKLSGFLSMSWWPKWFCEGEEGIGFSTQALHPPCPLSPRWPVIHD